MISIGFPNIFNSTYTNLVEETATSQNIKLLLESNVRTFFGDPYFGSNIKRFLFDQNSEYLKEVISDELTVCLNEFIPQIKIPRNGIDITVNKNEMSIKINCILKESGAQTAFILSLSETDLT